MNINYKLEGKLENGITLFKADCKNLEVDEIKLLRIKEICNEMKIGIHDLIIYFIENLTIEQTEEIIDKMDLSGIRALFNIKD